MHPCVLSGFDLESQTLQPLQFVCEISKGYLERDVVNGGSSSVRPSKTGALGAVEQGEYLSVTSVAVRNLEECGVRKSGHKMQSVLPVSLRRFSPDHSILQVFDRQSATHFPLLGYCANTRYSKFAEPKRRWSWSTIVRT
jgi:hypothetical protein